MITDTDKAQLQTCCLPPVSAALPYCAYPHCTETLPVTWALRPGKGPAGCHDSALWHGRDSRAGIAQLSRFLLQRMTSSAFLDFWMTDRGKCTLSGPLIIATTDFSLNFRVAGPSKCQLSEP